MVKNIVFHIVHRLPQLFFIFLAIFGYQLGRTMCYRSEQFLQHVAERCYAAKSLKRNDFGLKTRWSNNYRA